MKKEFLKLTLLLINILLLILSLNFLSFGQLTDSHGWISLFNGKDLEGWTVKIAKHPMGDNYQGTFFVEDGILKTTYAKYEKFDMQFGHLFTNIPYSHYIFHVEYRFDEMAPKLPDAPSWTNYNSGVMVHAQSPQSMRLTQGFPASIEAQILGVGATAGKQTANVVSPATHIELNGKLNTTHINDSKSKFYPLTEWVKFEVEVHGHELFIHRVNGEEVLRYARPVLDEKDKDGKFLLDNGASKKLSQGFIALQAEGSPVWFRDIKIKILEP